MSIQRPNPPITRKSIVFPITGLLSIIIGVVVSLYTPYQTPKSKTSANQKTQPQQVRITNQNSHGFSISWTTPEKITSGAILWGKTESELKTTQGDSRTVTAEDPLGDVTKPFESQTHHVTVQISSPPTNRHIYFKILSGNEPYGGILENPTKNGDALTLILPSNPYDPTKELSAHNPRGTYSSQEDAFSPCGGDNETSCWRPYPIWGQAFNPDETPAVGALIYASLERDGVTITNIISTITNKKETKNGETTVKAGSWAIDLGNLRTRDLSNYGVYAPEEQYKLAVEVMTAEGSTRTGRGKNSTLNTHLYSVTEKNITKMERPSPLNIYLPEKGTAVLPLSIKIQGPSDKTKTIENVQVQLGGDVEKTIICHRTNGRFYGEIESFPRTATLYVKPPLHLSQKAGIVKLSEGTNTTLTPQSEFLGGDIDPQQDDIINMRDIGMLIKYFETENPAADINKDHIVDTRDLDFIIRNYKKKGVTQ